MRRSIAVLVAGILMTYNCLAQTTLFSEAIQPNLPTAISLVGDDLYVGTIQAETLLQKIELNNPGVATTIYDFDGHTGVWKMAHDPIGNDLYVYTFFDGGVHKFDLDQQPVGEPELAFSINGTIGGMAINDNKLYYSLYQGQPANGQIYSFDLVNGGQPELYFDDPNSSWEVRNMGVYDNDLFFTEFVSSDGINISKIPLDSGNPTKSLVSFFNYVGDQSMLIVGSQLYLGIESAASVILKLELTEQAPIEPQIMISDYPGSPLGLAFKDGLFYGSEGAGYTIVNFEDPDLSIGERETVEVTLFPNPTSNLLFVDHPSVLNSSYKLYSSTGALVSTGIYSERGIDLSQFPSGMYLLQIKTSQEELVKRVVKY